MSDHLLLHGPRVALGALVQVDHGLVGYQQGRRTTGTAHHGLPTIVQGVGGIDRHLLLSEVPNIPTGLTGTLGFLDVSRHHAIPSHYDIQLYHTERSPSIMWK